MHRTPPPFGQRRIIGAPAARPEARPEPDGPTPDQIARINTLTSTARANWLGLLAYLAFVGVTLIGVEDADFFIPERATQLPLIGVTVPTFLFFAIAPTLGAALFVYLHLYLMKLWEALAEPPQPPGAPPLSTRITPWLVSDFALGFRRDGALAPGPLRPLASLVTLLLLFLAAPLVLGYFWWRSMSAHDPLLTLVWCGVPLLVTLHAMTASALRLWRVTRRPGARTVAPARPLWRRALGLTGYALRWAPVWAAVALLGSFRTHDSLETQLDRLAADRLGWSAERIAQARWKSAPWTADPFRLTSAQLAGVVFVETPANWLDHDRAREAFRRDWCHEQNLPPEVCGPVPSRDHPPAALQTHSRQEWCRTSLPPDTRDDPAACTAHFAALDVGFDARWHVYRRDAIAALPPRTLAGADMRGADLREARLEGANLRGARLDGANLRHVRIERADLVGASMDGADLSWAQMEGSVLVGARLRRAGLFEASMERADLREAQMDRAVLSGARLHGAILVEARLEVADLRGTRMEGANLMEARMEGAILSGARMEGAILYHAKLEGADLQQARMEGANLTGARLERADLFEARLEGARLNWARMNSANLSGARLEGAVLHGAQMELVGLSEARMEGAELSGARMEGADLFEARLEGANLSWARMDEHTSFGGATLQGVALNDQAIPMGVLSTAQIATMFGDASVTLPGVAPGGDDWPEHWPQRELDWHEFNAAWRAWQATLDGPPAD